MAPKVSEKYKEQKRKEMLNSARRVFIKNGYLRTTMQDIMDEAKISRGALYSYFKNIDDIFIEVLKLDDNEDIVLLQFNDHESIWEQFMEWIESSIDKIYHIEETLTIAKSEFFVSLNYKDDKEKFTYIKERHKVLTMKIESIIQIGINKGEFYPKACINSLAIYFISFFDGLMLNRFNLNMSLSQIEKQISIFQHSLKEILGFNDYKFK